MLLCDYSNIVRSHYSSNITIRPRVHDATSISYRMMMISSLFVVRIEDV